MAGTYDWNVAQTLAASGIPFDALIFAAIIRADNSNLDNLMMGFPNLVTEASLHWHGAYDVQHPPKVHVDQNRTQSES